MPQQRTCRLCHLGAPQRNKRHALWGKINGNTSDKSWVLLAKLEDKLHKFCKKMQSMSKTRKLDPSADRRVTSLYFFVALCYLGNEYPQTFPHGPWAKKIFTTSCWLLHQVGRGRTFGNNYCSECSKVPLKKFPHMLRHFMCHHNWQWFTVY